MGMTVIELKKITLRSLYNKLKGFRKSQKDAWEMMRIQVYYSVMPYVSEEDKDSITPLSLVPLPWDEEVIEQIKETTQEKAERLRKERNEGWAKIDAW
ncbi:hypothetical protein [Flagellimonas sp.]|uniref:hypothetical protein n=1 Tax=Flagellimonas sp. TaxID=2058762 RepID=UPI003F4A1A02